MSELNKEQVKAFDLNKYLDDLRNEDGSILSIEQRAARKLSIQKNGLCGFDNGLMVTIVHPEPID